jgi:single-stranded-DNA-specific exonuclease
MTDKRWVVKKEEHTEAIDKLTASLNVERVIARLLTQRGILTFSDARDFFRPSLENLHDPFLLKDMDVAIARIQQALDKRERILIYGDYDVDGTTAVALTYEFLCEFSDRLDYYIPNRDKEGYGISYAGIDYAQETGVKLIISLDCGIKAYNQVAYARERGIDFIVVDHHRPGEEPLPAVAVVDPKQPGCPYPYKELSGCGLGFKLAQAYYQKNRMPFEKLERFLDLVVVSIAADVVPITGENRILAHFGLRRLNLEPRPGLESILFYSNIFRKAASDDRSAFTRELTVNDLMFLIGPKINAAGRIENGKKAVDLLLCDRMGDTHELSLDINDQNTERRSLDTEITRQALKMIAADPVLKHGKATVLYNPGWHKGVIGIVASRLIETYYRPTIILTESNGLITGSARSVKDFDVYDAIDACSEHLEHFGGHKYAAGLSVRPENFEAFREAFTRVVNDTITDDMLIPEIEVDAEADLKDLQGKFFRILKQFAPFGPGNTNPIFVSRNCTVRGTPRVVGGKHLKFNVTQPEAGPVEMAAIAFQQGHHQADMLRAGCFDLAYQVEENEWNGRISLQLHVKDIKFPGNNS